MSYWPLGVARRREKDLDQLVALRHSHFPPYPSPNLASVISGVLALRLGEAGLVLPVYLYWNLYVLVREADFTAQVNCLARKMASALYRRGRGWREGHGSR